MASSSFRILLLLFLFVSIISTSLSLTCNSQRFSGNKLYDRCADLSQLDSYLHWTYDAVKSTLSVAFISQPAKPEGWISWAINPTGSGMVGAQAFVAHRQSNGSMALKSYNISSYMSIVESELSFVVKEKRAEISGQMMTIFATIVLPEKGMTSVNHVWQVGSSVTGGGFPNKHDVQPANLNSKASLDLLSGQITSSRNDRTRKKTIHGILNAVSWGIMFPIGIIIARYMRTFQSADPLWFYLHIFCQCSSYAIGVSGWATGLKLGSESSGVTYSAHRNIGIALFSLATLQIFALFLRPKKDHKYRFYWNIYHHGTGYAILILGIINVFKGLKILQPQQTWRTAYIIVISALGGIAVLLEAVTWIIVMRKKSRKSTTKPFNPS